ncbi:MAG TPA: PE-PPE domain-containing protein [Mycobacterium sp.]|nr:PE-PPE domain-containing protein [Mycobacterium sp.]
MNGYRLLAKVTAAGLFVGLAGATINGAARAYADDSLAGSDTAIILGGTTEPMPSTAFAQTAESLFLNPLGFDGGATGSTVCDMIGTDPCAAPLQVLTTPELIQQGPSSLTAADDVTLAVENEFNADPSAFSAEHPLTIFGYSQSATAESIAMTQLQADGIPSDDLHFVFIGDPSLPGGIWPNLEPDMDAVLGPSLTNTLLTDFNFGAVLGNVTPDDLYPATIYSLATDPVPNFQDVFEAKGLYGALLDIFGPHVEYLGLTPTEVADATTTTNGDLTLVDISDADINNADAWLSAVFEHGAAGSGLLESVFESLQLFLTNTF